MNASSDRRRSIAAARREAPRVERPAGPHTARLALAVRALALCGLLPLAPAALHAAAPLSAEGTDAAKGAFDGAGALHSAGALIEPDTVAGTPLWARLTAAGSVRGRVRPYEAANSGHGEPPAATAAGLRIRLWQQQQCVAETQSDADGGFRFSRLAPGTYVLTVDDGQQVAIERCHLVSRDVGQSHLPRDAEQSHLPRDVGQSHCAADDEPAHELAVAWGEPVVRGKGWRAVPRLPRLTLPAALVGGALAAPAMHAAIRRENRTPLSP